MKLLIPILSFAPALAMGAGFSKGSSFSSIPVQGQVQVFCNSITGTGSAIYTCRDVLLNPQAYDIFVGPQDTRAKKLDLSCAREDGSVRVRASAYDGISGKSTDSFNLWISTLFQKPLLYYGKNKLSYTIKSEKNEIIEQGNFEVMVTKGAMKECPTATYYSSDMNDCNSQYSVCQRYFEEFNNCQ